MQISLLTYFTQLGCSVKNELRGIYGVIIQSNYFTSDERIRTFQHILHNILKSRILIKLSSKQRVLALR